MEVWEEQIRNRFKRQKEEFLSDPAKWLKNLRQDRDRKIEDATEDYHQRMADITDHYNIGVKMAEEWLDGLGDIE